MLPDMSPGSGCTDSKAGPPQFARPSDARKRRITHERLLEGGIALGNPDGSLVIV
jgi:hypothetical protein